MDAIPFDKLQQADLVVDRVYEGGPAKNRGADPLTKLLRVGNVGGFRARGSIAKDDVKYLVLYTSFSEPDWPDFLDRGSGTFFYYGDNRKPGNALHGTPKQGNVALRRMFERAGTEAGRQSIPPIFLFAKAERGADVRFLGLLVPGSPAVDMDEQLVAIWRTSENRRFQNYRAAFSVLDAATVRRSWIESLASGRGVPDAAPEAWLRWIKTGLPDRLLAPRTVEIRTHVEQLPDSAEGRRVVDTIYRHFSDRPTDFEACAAEIWTLIAPATEELVVTRASRDGGRDAVGLYRIGPTSDPIKIDFALEAKCYNPLKGVGVREVSRLISRLRHRNFGVLVTTSFVNPQAYREIREDAHPVVILSGADIFEILKSKGLGSSAVVHRWLADSYPHPEASSKRRQGPAIRPEFGHGGAAVEGSRRETSSTGSPARW